MRKVVTVLAAGLITLPILAEQKPTVTPAPAKTVQQQGSTPTPDAQRGKPTKEQRQMTGKVLRQSGSTFTVLSGGKEVTFSVSKAGDTIPKVGETIDITYIQTPNGPQAITIIRSKSNITNN